VKATLVTMFVSVTKFKATWPHVSFLCSCCKEFHQSLTPWYRISFKQSIVASGEARWKEANIISFIHSSYIRFPFLYPFIPFSYSFLSPLNQRIKLNLYGRMPSSGMWRRVDLVWTDVSEERIVSIFRVEISANQEPAWAGGCRLQSTLLMQSLSGPIENTASSIVVFAASLHSNGSYLIVAYVFVAAEMYLPSSYLAMGLHVTISIYCRYNRCKNNHCG
jgi:hypothetical protein